MQVAGGWVLAAATVVVGVCAVYVLWLAVPILSPPAPGSGMKSLRVVNPDANIVRPIPPSRALPQPPGIVPTPSATDTVIAMRPATGAASRRVASATSRSASAVDANDRADADDAKSDGD